MANTSQNIIWIDGCDSHVGTKRPELPQDGEGPLRKTRLETYGLSATTVNNADFAAFVASTGYRSDAHRIGWSFVFRGLVDRVNGPSPPGLPWWVAVEGATWDHPLGPGSDWSGFGDHPVVHVSHGDALAYAAWVGGRLPTEAEWEHAARGGRAPRRYPWGEEEPDDKTVFCNIWQGDFPNNNTEQDGYYGTCPVNAFAPNTLGFLNMSGNVWEWCSDRFKVRSLSKAARARNTKARQENERVLKGGSFLCHISYCWRYRIAARSGRQPDNSSSHVGFRVAFSKT